MADYKHLSFNWNGNSYLRVRKHKSMINGSKKNLLFIPQWQEILDEYTVTRSVMSFKLWTEIPLIEVVTQSQRCII